MPVIYPFTAIVGQERMKRALVLNAVDPRIGGVLIRGERGTAKSTAARALAALLPVVDIIGGCRFGCDPENQTTWCTECRERFDSQTNHLPVETRPTAFINLPVSATEDRVVGTLDIERAIQKGERAFEPGVLAAANRGLLYIDEVNLLDDHVVDVLLDSAAMGVNVVEREGISFSHPARFILVGTMNPEEGDLRPQLTDRFALSVEIRGIRDARERVDIMQRNLNYEADSEAFREKWLPKERELSERIKKAREIIDEVTFTSRDLLTIANITSAMNVDGHRADLVILKAARAQAAFDGRKQINELDIGLAAELALPHRLKRGPFQQGEMTMEEMQERIEQLTGGTTKGKPSDVLEPTEEELPDQKKKATEGTVSEETSEHGQIKPSADDVFSQNDSLWWDGGQMIQAGEEFSPRRLDTPLDKIVRRFSGRRSRTRTERKRGRYVQSRPTPGKADDLALDATLRAAAPFQKSRAEERKKVAFSVKPGDYMRKVRVRRASNLILFLVDASWSMAVAERMSATKGAILSLLTDAYQRRDRVGLVVFQKDRATLVLPPTNSVTLAQQALEAIPVGGKTPLSAGLQMAYDVLRKERTLHPDVMPLMIVLTDGAGNVSMSSMPPQEEAYRIAEQIAKEQSLHCVVINLEHSAFDQGLAKRLGVHLDAQVYTISELKAENLYQTVRQEVVQAEQNRTIEDKR